MLPYGAQTDSCTPELLPNLSESPLFLPTPRLLHPPTRTKTPPLSTPSWSSRWETPLLLFLFGESDVDCRSSTETSYPCCCIKVPLSQSKGHVDRLRAEENTSGCWTDIFQGIMSPCQPISQGFRLSYLIHTRITRLHGVCGFRPPLEFGRPDRNLIHVYNKMSYGVQGYVIFRVFSSIII